MTVLQEAMLLLFKVAVPRRLLPSKNVTVPVRGPLLAVTIAVKVTVLLASVGFDEDPSVVALTMGAGLVDGDDAVAYVTGTLSKKIAWMIAPQPPGAVASVRNVTLPLNKN